MSGLRRLVERHGGWLLASGVVVVVLGVLTGWWLVALYGFVNSAGTVLHLDGLGPRSLGLRRRRRVLVPLTVLQLPVGIGGLLASRGGRTPTDAMFEDEGVRTGMAGSFPLRDGGGHGGA
jgi:hypothetical protein